MKTLNSRQWASIKRIAQNVAPLVSKKYKLMQEIATISNKIDDIQKEIEAQEAGVKLMTGYSVGDLIIITKDEDKKVSYTPNKSNVHYNEETKQYEIMDPLLMSVLEEPTTEEQD